MGETLVYSKLSSNIKIPSGSMSVYYYNITLKDNVMSNPVVYAVINDECHECIDSQNCTVKVKNIWSNFLFATILENLFFFKFNKCDINYVCYNMNDINPKNQSEKCDPSKSLFTWSKLGQSSKASNMPCITTFYIYISFLIQSKLFLF